MRYWNHKLALFFTVQTLAVAAMIWLYWEARQPDCDKLLDSAGPSAPAMLLAIALFLGELAAMAAVLRHHVPVWYSLVGLGAVFLVTAFVFAMDVRHDIWIAMAIWHVVLALILLGVGAAAAFWRLLEKLRRPDAQVSEDSQSTAMWPLD